MENPLIRHRNLTVLVAVLFLQVVGLAVQVQRTSESGSTRLIRVWAVSAITPVEKGVVHTQQWMGGVWRNYLDLRNVRRENQGLRDENQRLRLEAVRLSEDAGQARRLQALLAFKEQFIQKTLAAQVISTTGSEFSRGIYIDKGSSDGVKIDMPVITPEGIIGKVYRTYPNSSLVLEINDPSSGAGVILDKSRLQGILKGNAAGETIVRNIMADEQVQVGERVVTSGGDGIFPKGMPVGMVSSVNPEPDHLFLAVRVKPAANLNRVEEVLVITSVVEKAPEGAAIEPRQSAADILADRLPHVPPKPPEAPPGSNPAAPGTPGSARPAGSVAPQPAASHPLTAPGSAAAPAQKPPAASNTVPPPNSPAAVKPGATKSPIPPTKEPPRQ